MPVEHWDSRRDGAFTEAAMAEKLRHRGYHVTRYVYPAGTVFAPHRHDVDKIDAVISGCFRMTMPGQTLDLMAGDCLAVPRGVVHSAAVIGSAPVVSLDAIKAATVAR